jgi:PAS domain S-box-containing protein
VDRVRINSPEPPRQDLASDKILEFLSELSRHPAIESGDLDTVTSYVVSRAADLIDADNLGVWLFDDSRENLCSILRFNIRRAEVCEPVVLPARRIESEFNAFRTSPLVAIEDALNDPRAADFRDIFIVPNGITSILDHVIRSAGEDVGVFSFERCGTVRPWRPAEMALARSISSYLSLAYANRKRRQAEDAQHISEIRLRALTDNLPGAVYQRLPNLDAPFIYVSSGISRFTGDTAVLAEIPDAIGWAAFVQPEDLSRVENAYAAARSGSEFSLEYRLRHPGGEEMWVLDRGRGSLQKDGTATIDGVLFNITPRKRAEKVAMAATSLQSAILNNVAYAVISTDAKGTITFFNRAAEELLGYGAAELVGRQTPLIFHDLTEIQSRIEIVRQKLGRDIDYPFEIFTIDALDGHTSENEWTYIRKDGKRLTTHLSVTMMRTADGEVSGFLGIATDVSDRKALASKLRQSEDVAARILLQSPDAILITSMKDGCIHEANPGFEQITGIPRQDAIGHSTIALGIWADLEERNIMIDTIRRTGEVTSLPIRINHRSGKLRYCAMWARTFTYEGGPALLSVVHDVTDLRMAAQASQESERMLKAVLDAIPSRVFWKDLNSVYLGYNREFVGDFSASGDEDIIGKTDAVLPWASKADSLRAADRNVMETGNPQIGLIERFEMPSGPPRWFEVSKMPLIDAQGRVSGILGIANDVTEQRQALDQLRANEEKLRSLFETSPLGVTLTSIEGRLLEANDAFLSIIGYDRQELEGLSYQVLSAPEYAQQDAYHVDVLAATGRYGPYEKEYVRKDGTRIAVSLNGSMVSGPDGAQFVWSTIEDVTLRRAAEDAQRRLNDDLERLVTERTSELKSAMEGLMRAEKLASLGSLVAGVAHEISTPVGNASLATSTMSGSVVEFETQMGEKLTREMLESFVKQIKLGTEIANRNIERVAGLIQSFKQVAVDQTSSQRRQFLLTEIVDEIATTMHPSLKRSSVRLETAIQGDITLDSYPGPLGQILTNLINNSLLHAFPDGRAGLIRIAANQPDSVTLRLIVSDNGIGIPASVRGRIFDPFFTSKLGRGGSGLGLHIVHNIAADILAGSIVVSSEEGQGTSFTLTLPCKSPEPPPADLSDRR